MVFDRKCISVQRFKQSTFLRPIYLTFPISFTGEILFLHSCTILDYVFKSKNMTKHWYICNCLDILQKLKQSLIYRSPSPTPLKKNNYDGFTYATRRTDVCVQCMQTTHSNTQLVTMSSLTSHPQRMTHHWQHLVVIICLSRSACSNELQHALGLWEPQYEIISSREHMGALALPITSLRSQEGFSATVA